MTEPSQEQTLLTQLGSEKRSVQISAIVQLAKISANPETVFRLRKLAEGGDREITFFAVQAVTKIQARLGQKPDAQPKPPVEAAAGEAEGSGPAPEESLDRTRLLAPLKEEIPRVLQLIRQFPERITEELKPPVAVFLGKHGQEGDAPWLANQLQGLDSNLALPFIDALESIAPQALLPLLPNLLAAPLPLVRCRAISALRRIDPEEAEGHLSELLASRKPEDRLAGLSVAFLFPFSKVKEYLFAILQEDQDPEVIKGCGTLLASNPERESALRLLAIIDTAEKKRAAALSSIFRDLCQMLAAAGIVPEAEAKPEAMIKIWRQERLKKFLGDLEVQIAVTTGPRRDSMEAWLGKNMELAEARALVERLALNPSTEEISRRLLQNWSQERQLAALAGGPGQYSDEDKRQFLRKLDAEQFKIWIQWVRQEAGSGPPMVMAAALNTLQRLDASPDCLALAEKAIGHPDPGVQVAATRLVEKFDPKRLVPLLPTFLGSQDARLRARGIRIALDYDERAALTALESMLNAAEPGIRANAVSCLSLFPVEKVTSLLLKTLQKEDHSAIARQILVVLQSNPSMDLLDQLDRLHIRSNPSVALTIAQARMDLFDIILKLGLEGDARPAPKAPPSPVSKPSPVTAPSPTDAGAANAPPEAGPAAEQAEGTKAYSVSQVRTAIRHRQTAARAAPAPAAPEKGSTWGNLNAWVLVIAVTGFLAFMPTLFLRLAGPATQGDPQPRVESFDPRKEDQATIHHTEVPEGLRMNRMSKVTGKVKEKLPDGTILFSFQDKTFLLEGLATMPFLVGDEEVEVEMLPYQILKDGTIVAECHTFTPRK